MGDFAADTALEGAGGRYRARLSPEWKVWGPLGGYVAAIALRAMGEETPLRRPASITCHFLAPGEFEEADVEVTTLRRGKRSQALHVRMSQRGNAFLTATGWVVDTDMSGLAHDLARMPDVPAPGQLRSYAEVADNYQDWYPVWQGSIDGKPTQWDLEQLPGDPFWRTWMRLERTPSLDDPFLDAARSLMWMDLMMWNAATAPHPWPPSHIAPNLDVSAIFHASAATEEWLLCDGEAPVGADGIVGCAGRVWTPAGRLVASGNSCLFCRPNPFLPPA
jgi:acyl-CoA thioesterase II